MDAIIIVDMQVGLLDGPPKHDLRGLIDRINALSAMVRGADGTVLWVRHCGKAGDEFERNAAGWHFLPQLIRREEDVVIEKTLNDLRGIALRRPIAVVGRGRASRDAIERHHPWLSQVVPPSHHGIYSIYRSGYQSG